MIKLLTLADLITLVNALFGLCAILLVFSHLYYFSAVFILLGLLVDGLDGMVARRRGNGPLGDSLETIADMVSLSVAPLALLYMTYFDAVQDQLVVHGALVAVLIFSFLCSVLRLASFPSLKDTRFFVGLPTSASALFLVACSFLKVDVLYVLPFIILFSVGMISQVHFPKPDLKLNVIIAASIFVTILLEGMVENIGPLFLLAALVVYCIAGPVYLLRKKRVS